MNTATKTAPSLERRYRCVGVDDAASSCSCCGRQGLKRVAWLVDVDGLDDAAPYGTTCAVLMLLGRKVPAAEAKRTVDAAFEAECNARIDAIVARWRLAEVPAATRTVNKYGTVCYEIGGREIPVVHGCREDEQLVRAISRWRSEMAYAEARDIPGAYLRTARADW